MERTEQRTVCKMFDLRPRRVEGSTGHAALILGMVTEMGEVRAFIEKGGTTSKTVDYFTTID